MMVETSGEIGLAPRTPFQRVFGEGGAGLEVPEDGEMSDTVKEKIEPSDVMETGDMLEEESHTLLEAEDRDTKGMMT